MGAELEVISVRNGNRWQDELEACGRHDFYHRADYHELDAARLKARAVLLTWRHDEARAALPLLLSPVSANPGLEEADPNLIDARSAYGYLGPVRTAMTAADVRSFQQAISHWLRNHGVVSVFSRLHPLIESASLCEGMGEVVDVGPTVSINLNGSSAEQVGRYRSNHRRDLRKLVDNGFTCEFASGPEGIATFASIYRENMNRVGAAPAYFFDDAYFDALAQIPGMRFVLCRHRGAPCASAIVSFYGEIAQYHLGGTRTEWLRHAPMKLIFDFARDAAAAAECRTFHLGGGLGAREDALFNFKAGFSSDRHVFQIWRWVVDKEAYSKLVAMAGQRSKTGFFPAYSG